MATVCLCIALRHEGRQSYGQCVVDEGITASTVLGPILALKLLLG